MLRQREVLVAANLIDMVVAFVRCQSRLPLRRKLSEPAQVAQRADGEEEVGVRQAAGMGGKLLVPQALAIVAGIGGQRVERGW